MGCIGGLTVVSNLGYQRRPDLLVPIIQKVSQVPLIATAHKTHEQTGEIMGLAFEFKRSLEPAGTGSPTNSPLFLLAHQEPNARISTDSLQRMLTQLPRPICGW